jgi:hypothetical protein
VHGSALSFGLALIMTAFIGQKYDANTINLNDIEKSSVRFDANSMQISSFQCKPIIFKAL